MRPVPVLLALAIVLAAAVLGGLVYGASGVALGVVIGLVAGFVVVVVDQSRRIRAESARHEADFEHRVLGALGRPDPRVPHPRAPWLRLVPQQLSADLTDVIARVMRRSRSDLPGALAEGERLAKRYPNSAAVHRLLTFLHLRAGFRHRALAAASRAIRLALHRGDTPEAVEAYRLCRTWRDELTLDAESYGRLGRLLLYRNDLDGAAWASQRAAALRGGGASTRPS